MIKLRTDIDDYTLLSAPRRGRRSGGSAVYIHNSVSYHTRDDLKLILDPQDNVDHSESILLKSLFPMAKILLWVIFTELMVLIQTHLSLIYLIALQKLLPKISTVMFLVTLI